MQQPLQITFRNLPHSEALAAHVRERAEKLEGIFDHIISCHVVVELAPAHHGHGNRCRFSINLGLPGHEVLVNHAPHEGHVVEHANANADRTFDEAERQLVGWMGRLHERRYDGDIRDIAESPK